MGWIHDTYSDRFLHFTSVHFLIEMLLLCLGSLLLCSNCSIPVNITPQFEAITLDLSNRFIYLFIAYLRNSFCESQCCWNGLVFYHDRYYNNGSL